MAARSTKPPCLQSFNALSTISYFWSKSLCCQLSKFPMLLVSRTWRYFFFEWAFTCLNDFSPIFLLSSMVNHLIGTRPQCRHLIGGLLPRYDNGEKASNSETKKWYTPLTFLMARSINTHIMSYTFCLTSDVIVWGVSSFYSHPCQDFQY